MSCKMELKESGEDIPANEGDPEVDDGGTGEEAENAGDPEGNNPGNSDDSGDGGEVLEEEQYGGEEEIEP